MRLSPRPRDLVLAAFPSFRGRKIATRFEGEVVFYDLNWSGGTKNTYRAVRLSDGKAQGLPDLPPWANPVEGTKVSIPRGFAIVELSWFCGTGPRATIYHAEDPPLSASREVPCLLP